MPNVNRDCQISIRLTEKEKTDLKICADAAGLRVVEFVRNLILQETSGAKKVK